MKQSTDAADYFAVISHADGRVDYLEYGFAVVQTLPELGDAVQVSRERGDGGWSPWRVNLLHTDTLLTDSAAEQFARALTTARYQAVVLNAGGSTDLAIAAAARLLAPRA